MDSLRRSLQFEEYLTRPLRIWMYDKDSLTTHAEHFFQGLAGSVTSNAYQIYSPEYYIQDYFQRLNDSSMLSRRNLQWSDDPLLADYFIVPCNFMFFYFNHQPTTMTAGQFKNLLVKLNENYLEKLLARVHAIFPYWTMTERADHAGDNHIIALLADERMELLHEKIQTLLTNVIRLTFTGNRQDLLLPKSQRQ